MFAGLFTWFYQVSASPAEVNNQQSILIYTDSPSVPMYVSFGFDDRSTNSALNSAYLFLSVDPSYQGDTVDFTIAFRGEEFRLRDSEFADRIGDCTLDIAFVSDDLRTCKDAKNLQGVTEIDGLNESQLLSGTIRRREGGVFTTSVTVFAKEGWSSLGAKRTAFSLPKVGTSYRQPHWAPTSESLENQRLFHPDVTTLTLTYRTLRADEKVEIVAPAVSEDNSLYWQRDGSGSIKAHGSTVRLGMEERQSNETFLIGVLAGLVPLIVVWFHKQLGQLLVPKAKRK